MKTQYVFAEDVVRRLPLPPPDDGDGRIYYRDSKTPGLQVAVFASGLRAYYFSRRVDGRPTRIRLGEVGSLSLRGAREACAVHAGQIAAGQNPVEAKRIKREQPTLTDLWDHWAAVRSSKKSWYEDERQWNTLLRPLAARRVADLRRGDVVAWHARLGREHGRYAANAALALLRAMIFEGIRSEIIGGTNPAAGIAKFKTQSRDRFLQPGEVQSLMTALDQEIDPWPDFFRLLLYAGVRKSSLMQMTWKDVDLDQGLWRIGQTKNGDPLYLPLVPQAVEIIRGRPHDSDYVFSGRLDHLRNADHAWYRIRGRAGLDDLRIHDLRRSLASWMAASLVISRRAAPQYMLVSISSRKGRLWRGRWLPCSGRQECRYFIHLEPGFPLLYVTVAAGLDHPSTQIQQH